MNFCATKLARLFSLSHSDPTVLKELTIGPSKLKVITLQLLDDKWIFNLRQRVGLIDLTYKPDRIGLRPFFDSTKEPVPIPIGDFS
jgi:hypothetical protein